MMKLKLAIFHYHFLPGGVTSVVRFGIRSILSDEQAECTVGEIMVVSGGTPEGDGQFCQFLSDQHETARNRGITLSYRSVPELGYQPDGEVRSGSSRGELIELLTSQFSGWIWWIHNYHIGKNPELTHAILELATRRSTQTMLLQIHDFPENGRFANLSRLKRATSIPLYPIAPGIHYLTINRRDHSVLSRAGVPADRLHYMPNPVASQSPTTPPRRDEVRGLLENEFAGRFQGYRREGRLAFYPVRSIRRKNVLEAALGVSIAQEATNLIVTLPGLSSQELGYSNLVEELFLDGTISGMWGIGALPGADIPPFEDLARSMDFVISSSLEEGFGYLFIDALRWSKPLLGRRIDVLEELLPLLPEESTRLYSTLKVPVSPDFAARVRSHIEESRRVVAEFVTGHGYEIDIALPFPGGRELDFSFLYPEDQAALLRRVASDEGYREEIGAMNREFCEAISNIEKSGSWTELEIHKMEQELGMGAFHRRLNEILSCAGSESSGYSDKMGSEEVVLASFATVGSFRPLLFSLPTSGVES